MLAHVAIQCTARDGTAGSFLFAGDHPSTGETVSPVFPDLVALVGWTRANGWKEVPMGTPGRSATGSYVRAEG